MRSQELFEHMHLHKYLMLSYRSQRGMLDPLNWLLQLLLQLQQLQRQRNSLVPDLLMPLAQTLVLLKLDILHMLRQS